MVNQGCNIRVLDDYAVRVAYSNGHLDVVEYLITQGTELTSST
ncbi:hypothetical protein QJ850_gp016 [Acanthamoeba polyphaga mimivirus]|uniref:Ankyrin repeat protein n=1 Tax=Acanthamoeba polyphaga mimivirus Kroon TaxID=3069720 RepID=A0A0G2Y1Z7_9VIRU|nr:hypothetical protein QJ850_gp016 [Acanthamoeba polyphaga mimivirus]AKI79745.1 hypothetical protein [Acanthamoeba polyphaga mimivirus Kroon]